jgi:MATE family multidrug resistance protein
LFLQKAKIFNSSALRKFLESQGAVRPSFVVSSIVVPLHVGLCYLCTQHFGFFGAAVSVVVSTWFQFLFLLAIVWWQPLLLAKDAWPGWSFAEAQSEWGPYLRLAIPGLLMLSLEWWSWEVLALMAGRMGEIPMAAHGILATACSLCYRMPVGTGRSASIKVGQLVGKGKDALGHPRLVVCLF